MIEKIEQEKTYGIRTPLLSSTGSTVVELFDSSQVILSPETETEALQVDVACYLHELRATALISSLDEGIFPDFELTDTQSQQIAKVGFARWGQPRKHMKLLLGDNNGWSLVNLASFINPQQYPLESINLLPYFSSGVSFPLGAGQKLGVQLEDAGFGLLEGADLITVFGAVTAKIQILFQGGSSAQDWTTVVTPQPTPTP